MWGHRHALEGERETVSGGYMKSLCRAFGEVARRGVWLCCAVALWAGISGLWIGFAQAQDAVPIALTVPGHQSGAPLIIRNDRGGPVGMRAREISALQQSNRHVELRGRVCLSSCTMYLALDRVCVSAATTFGFHGPSYYGRPLSSRDFEHWSQVIASHYPARLKRWYLETGRHRNSGYYRIKGRKLIEMGVAPCH